MNNSLQLVLSISKAGAVLNRKLSGHGLDLTDFAILHYLNQAENKQLRRIDLADKLGLSASGVTRMLLPLEKIHIISRDLDDSDARARYATLSPAGEELYRDALATMEMKLEDIVPENQNKDIETSLNLINQII